MYALLKSIAYLFLDRSTVIIVRNGLLGPLWQGSFLWGTYVWVVFHTISLVLYAAAVFFEEPVSVSSSSHYVIRSIYFLKLFSDWFYWNFLVPTECMPLMAVERNFTLTSCFDRWPLGRYMYNTEFHAFDRNKWRWMGRIYQCVLYICGSFKFTFAFSEFGVSSSQPDLHLQQSTIWTLKALR